MKNICAKFVIVISCLAFLSGCARDLSSNVYTSDSSLSLTLEGKIVSSRPVIVKESDKLSGNKGGILAGALAGGAVGNTVGGGSGHGVALIGGALAGSLIGSLVESSLSKADGIEYIVQVDNSKLKSDYYEGNAAMRSAISAATTSGLLTIVQGKDAVLSAGQDVYVIFSSNRTRVIPKQF